MIEVVIHSASTSSLKDLAWLSGCPFRPKIKRVLWKSISRVRSAETWLGAGPILINMIHEVHNLRMLCGDIVAVQAFGSNAIRGFAVEDTVAINLRFANGALGTFMLSDTAASAKSWEQTSQENKSYANYDDEDCYVITGTNGTLSVPTMRLKTYPRPEDRSWWKAFDASVVSMVRDDPLKLQIEHFGAVIRGEAQPLVSAYDGLQNLRVTEAIFESTKTGQIVALNVT